MTASAVAIDLKAALQSPASVFAEPNDIVEHPALPISAKFKLLEQWERDARALAVAEDEGMGGGEQSMLSRVRLAMRQLELRADPKNFPANAASGARTKFES